MTAAPRVLLVGGADEGRAALRAQLPPEWSVREADGMTAALARLDESPSDVVVTDAALPARSGADLLRAVRVRHPGVWPIVVTSQPDGDDVRALRRAGSALVLERPTDAADLRAWIEHGATMARLSQATSKPPIERRRTERPRRPSS